jgi:hypothetical protein
MVIRFITFGSHKYYKDAAIRLSKQARDLDLFSEVMVYTSENLKADPEFWTRHEKIVLENKRGYGYWIWKPYILQKNMEAMKDGDILMYLDCGCEIDIKKRQKLQEYLEFIKQDKHIGSITCLEKDWNKMDLVEKLNMKKDEFLNSPQRAAGSLLFLVCADTRNMIDEWYRLACDYHNIDDSPSTSPNLPSFIEHRHDQSIYSLLSKKYNLYSKYDIRNAIHYIRNCSGTSKLSAPCLSGLPSALTGPPLHKTTL